MIILSGVLVVVAIALLVAGIVAGNGDSAQVFGLDALVVIYISIAVSIVSALCLAIGVFIRRRELFGVGAVRKVPPSAAKGKKDKRSRKTAPAAKPAKGTAETATLTAPAALNAPADDEVAIPVQPADVPDDAVVFVVRGRKRYHLATCRQLAGRDKEELTYVEAKEEGFSPCTACMPDTALAARAAVSVPAAPARAAAEKATGEKATGSGKASDGAERGTGRLSESPGGLSDLAISPSVFKPLSASTLASPSASAPPESLASAATAPVPTPTSPSAPRFDTTAESAPTWPVPAEETDAAGSRPASDETGPVWPDSADASTASQAAEHAEPEAEVPAAAEHAATTGSAPATGGTDDADLAPEPAAESSSDASSDAPAAAPVPSAPVDDPSDAPDTVDDDEGTQVRILSGTKRYHRTDCALIEDIGDEADDLEALSRAEAKARGCTPCLVCQPDRERVRD